MGRRGTTRSSRTRRFLGYVALVGMLVAGIAGVLAIRQELEADERTVLEVDTALAETTPTTLAADEATIAHAAPQALLIGDLQLEGAVRSVGLEENGELEVPDATEIGWYEYGSSPGRPGATVLAAHVSWNGAIGPFHDLGDLEPGATVDVVLDDGTVRTYEVTERTMYPKESLPADRIWRTSGDETLVLITCGGDFNPSIRRYRHNIVVYAVPVSERPPVVEIDAAPDAGGT